jgi:Glycine zipper
MTPKRTFPRPLAVARVLGVSLAVVYLVGCADEPPPRRVVHRTYSEPPRPNTDVYAYPVHGQTPEQQDRDRYECTQWAVKQTGFDPSAPNVPPHERVRVVSAGPPPGTGTAVGAVTGAILGAAVAGPRDAGAGAVVGAIAGGAVGTAADASRQREVHEYVTQDRQAVAAMEQKASNYRRAITACLDARGYSVR